MWFEALAGFREESPDQVRANLVVDGETMTSSVNGRTMSCGRLETPSLAELRLRVRAENVPQEQLRLSEVVADVQQLHIETANAGSLFQVASQFNLLEMVSPSVTPDEGVGIYENDRTQGPACAIACGAGTIYRNYFAEVNGRVGQSADNQFDCLRDLGNALGNSDQRLWAMRNGYALASADGLREISRWLSAAHETERDSLRELLRIGIQWGTQVTLGDCPHTVTQVYCSALPVAYSSHSAELWAEFARLVLEASYEATLCAAILNRRQTGNNRVFLTLLGGGAFGNRDDWILGAIERALQRFADAPLDVAIVSYGSSKRRVQQLIKRRTMNWDDCELTVEFLTGDRGHARSDPDGIHLKCVCGVQIQIPNKSSFDWSPGSRFPVTGGFIADCPHCNALFGWNLNSPDVLTELSQRHPRESEELSESD